MHTLKRWRTYTMAPPHEYKFAQPYCKWPPAMGAAIFQGIFGFSPRRLRGAQLNAAQFYVPAGTL